MPKTTGRSPYDPQITPERSILKAKEDMLRSMIGTTRAIRYGEQYLTSCRCGSYIVTSNVYETDKFQDYHDGC